VVGLFNSWVESEGAGGAGCPHLDCDGNVDKLWHAVKPEEMRETKGGMKEKPVLCTVEGMSGMWHKSSGRWWHDVGCGGQVRRDAGRKKPKAVFKRAGRDVEKMATTRGTGGVRVGEEEAYYARRRWWAVNVRGQRRWLGQVD
jgi:hypothetical protein